MLFKRRLDAFMTTYLPLNKPGLLGKVTHFVIRLEVQARGSCECMLLGAFCSQPLHADILNTRVLP